MWIRSIPAWAGKPWIKDTFEASWCGVHPRVGGETPDRACEDGSRVHPRVGGETVMISASRSWVHPRVGGETRQPGAGTQQGPSPRGRGNQRRSRCRSTGSIPAWAGKPDFRCRTGRRAMPGPSPRGRGNPGTAVLLLMAAWVHPRVGGETNEQARSIPAWAGKPSQRTAPTGSIPAWAGKPMGVARPSRVARVHPRVGGETSGQGPSPRGRPEPRGRGGPSPRGRGNQWLAGAASERCTGPSPRGRGNRDVERLRNPRVGAGKGPSPRGRGNPDGPGRETERLPGSIPAWAGKPPSAIAGHPRVGPERRFLWNGVHPRVGGETPRGRSLRNSAARLGSIPAWAGKPVSPGRGRCRGEGVHPRVGGETPGRTSDDAAGGVHPRVGGETGTGSTPALNRGPSPRGRGNHVARLRPCLVDEEVHPRVGGETAGRRRRLSVGGETLDPGPSPRGRGNPSPRCRSRSARPSRVHPRVGGETELLAHPRVGGETCELRAGQRSAVHPRVGGETAPDCRRRSSHPGPSPRGRGNHQGVHPRVAGKPRHGVAHGSIPAWAGKPCSTSPGLAYEGVHPRVGGETPWTVDAGILNRVHPRVGGETFGQPSDLLWGPSPRGRGNPSTAPLVHPRGAGRRVRGSIPAWAGKPRCSSPISAGSARLQGPSPRGRGNRGRS